MLFGTVMTASISPRSIISNISREAPVALRVAAIKASVSSAILIIGLRLALSGSLLVVGLVYDGFRTFRRRLAAIYTFLKGRTQGTSLR